MRRFALVSLVALFSFADAQTQILKLKNYRVSFLSDSLRESSGLCFLQGKLYTFNDSGNAPDFFQIDKKTGKILSTIKTDLKNEDWEAMTSDGENLYIGDFGNNLGTRRDLKIYRYYFKDKQAEIIPFFYPEQKDFSPKNIRNNFDGESLVFLNGKLHVFTKEWISKSVTHYVLDPGEKNNQPATKVENYHLGFVATDAAYFGNRLYIVGYTKKAEVFLDIFAETKPGIFFEKNPQRYYLGSALTVGQIEGVAVDSAGVYFSGEAFHTPLGTARQSFYFIPKEKLVTQ